MESIVREIRELYEWVKDESKKNKPPELEREHYILCVDIGHTRTKAALLEIKSRGNTIEYFQIGNCNTTESEPFFCRDNFELFGSWLSEQRKDKKIDGLAIALSCEVENNIPKNPFKWEWPQNLEELLHHKLGIDKIIFLNDAVAFAHGCLKNQSFSRLRYPILCLTLGTGIGCALLNKQEPKIRAFEVGDIWKQWPSGFEGNPHQFAGESFFAWANTENYSPEEIKRVYSRHIGWIIDTLKEQLAFSSIILGGGRASYLDINEILSILERKSIIINVVQGIETSLIGVGYAWIERYIH